MFLTDINSIESKLDQINPIAYGKSRNFLNGNVTRLSPYISRGVLSTKQILHHLINKNFDLDIIEKFIQELAWRDYWQLVWIEKKNQINKDLKHKQENVSSYGISQSIIDANTSIKAIDKGIKELYKTGYMHNHLRMYVASISCNVGANHWYAPARWMYYNLFDADWASNALSWQWVAGTNSNKKYFANQENINKYCNTNQENTFLDIEYHTLPNLSDVEELKEISYPIFKTNLPDNNTIKIDPNKATYIYNFYNLDPYWDSDIDANRVLLLEPSKFKEYPISDKVLNFIIDLSNNIENIQIFVGEFEDLNVDHHNTYYKEHPLNYNYKGVEISRDWMFSLKGYFPSFFSYWNKVKKELNGSTK